MSPLSEFDLVYLGSPYTHYPDGIDSAFKDVARLASKLLVQDINVYSPIAHGHPIAIHGELDPLDHSIWLKFDEAIMKKADALLVARMPSWKTSRGLHHEIEHFMAAEKPVYLVNPETLEIESMVGWTILPLRECSQLDKARLKV